jgi:hypothetical protein
VFVRTGWEVLSGVRTMCDALKGCRNRGGCAQWFVCTGCDVIGGVGTGCDVLGGCRHRVGCAECVCMVCDALNGSMHGVRSAQGLYAPGLMGSVVYVRWVMC